MKKKINEDLLIKHLLGETTREERALVDKWIFEHEDNRRKYDSFKLIWDTSRNLAQTTAVDENEAWNRFKKRVNEKSNLDQQKTWNKFSILKVAAILIFASIGLWLTYSIYGNYKRDNLITLQSTTETIADTLSDGSIIFLNKDSEIQFPKQFAKNNRTIRLIKGEAFFDIAPDAEKPFIVNVKDVKVKVVGTSFNINTNRGLTDIIVESGIVEVEKKDIIIRLKRNERVTIDKESSQLEKKEVSDQLYQYYRTKEFVADDTPLYRLIEVLNEAYDANIAIEDKDLENLSLNTTFKNKSLDSIVNIICETFNIKKKQREGQIILYR